MTYVIIGENVKNIEAKAFKYCTNLTDVYCKTIDVPKTSSDAFEDSYPEYITLHVPNESINAFKAVAPWNKFKNIIAINGDGPTPTDIKSNIKDNSNNNQYYTLKGELYDQPKHGINIIRMSNGTTKKVIIK